MAKNGKRLGFLPKWRIFSYVILAFNILMLILLITSINSASNDATSNCGTLNAQTCKSASDAGIAVGAIVIIVLWAVVDVILGILWLVTNRKKTRDCPACGRDVKKGKFVCQGCGYDFRSALGTAPAAPGYPPQS